MTSAFKTIGMIGKIRNSGVKETVKSLFHYLQNLNLNILIETETAEPLADLSIQTISREDIGNSCDLLIVIGGDGSMLHAVHDVMENEIPVLGINRGSLGFLTDIHPDEFEKIKNIIDGKYTIEKRFLLSTTIHLQNKIIGKDTALNEVTIIPDAILPHMIEFEIYIDNQFVCSQHSDGLIIATPTGSTAYALSGGGPILHPQLDAIVLVPMFPHTLSSRPIVIEGNKEIMILISSENMTLPRVSCDGRAYINTPGGSQIFIRKKTKKLHLIHPLTYNYYETLRSKLDWGKKISADTNSH